MKAALALGLLIIFMMAGAANAAASCASGPFIKACSACTFDASGKMNQACWKSYESEGQTCLATSYPMMALKYELSGCEQLDTCVQRLSACKEAHKSGSDAVDCKSAGMINCFTVADTCAERASEVCADGKTEEEAGFNNESAGGPIKDRPEENESLGPGNNVVPLSEGSLIDLICYGPPALLLLFGIVYRGKE
jgi:hypothetical protein